MRGSYSGPYLFPKKPPTTALQCLPKSKGRLSRSPTLLNSSITIGEWKDIPMRRRFAWSSRRNSQSGMVLKSTTLVACEITDSFVSNRWCPDEYKRLKFRKGDFAQVAGYFWADSPLERIRPLAEFMYWVSMNDFSLSIWILTIQYSTLSGMTVGFTSSQAVLISR